MAIPEKVFRDGDKLRSSARGLVFRTVWSCQNGESKLESAVELEGEHTQGAAAGSPRVAYEAFMAFPIPMALASEDGAIQLVNIRFRERYPLVVPEPRVLASAGRGAGGMWQRILLPMTPGDHHGTPARVISAEGRILLAVDDPEAVAPLDELMDLRDRIGALERLAAADHLTDAWNRTHFARIIAAEIGRSSALALPLSALLLDIDHFRRLAEEHGPVAAAQVLRELVGVVRARLRPSDLLFRWEREQFAVLLWGTAGERATGVAEDLRALIAAYGFAVGASVHVSIGVAEHGRGESVEEWFSRLEGALYDAKAAGRNRVVRDAPDEVVVPPTGWTGQRLDWGPAWASGAPGLDAEHRELFALANDLIDAAARPGATLAGIAGPHGMLVNQIRAHFQHEEVLLRELGYEREPEHRRVHGALLARAARLADEVAAGRGSIAALVDYLVGDVIAHHIQSVDRAYYPLFSAAPVA